MHAAQTTSNQGNYGQVSRPISTGKLNALQPFHPQPINVVIFQGSSGGDLILRLVSRLYAFSVYPFPT